MLFAIPSASFGCINAMLHQTFLFLGQLWQLYEVSQILEFLRYIINLLLLLKQFLLVPALLDWHKVKDQQKPMLICTGQVSLYWPSLSKLAQFMTGMV